MISFHYINYINYSVHFYVFRESRGRLVRRRPVIHDAADQPVFKLEEGDAGLLIIAYAKGS